MEFQKATESDLSDETSFASYVNTQIRSKTGPLRTTASLNRDPQYAATSFNISDILQGGLAVSDPSDPLLIANQFLTKRLDNIYESNPDKQFALLSGSFESTDPNAATNTVYGESGFNDDGTLNSKWVSSLPVVGPYSRSLQGPTTNDPNSPAPGAKNIMLWARSGLASEVMHLPVSSSIEQDIRNHIQSPDLGASRKHPYFMDRDAQDDKSTSAPFSGTDGYVYNWDYGEEVVSRPGQKTFGGEDPNRPGKKGAFGILDPKSEQWYVSMPWPSNLNTGQWTDIGLPSIDESIKKDSLILSDYLNCRILVYHVRSGKAVIATPGDMGPQPSKLNYSAAFPENCHLMGLSPDIAQYFGLVSMRDTVMVGFVDSSWQLGPYIKTKISPSDLNSGYSYGMPGSYNNNPISLSPDDWSVGTGSSSLVDSIEDIKYAMTLLRDHPNMWATKNEVGGTRNGHGPLNAEGFYKLFTNGFPWSEDAVIKVPGSKRTLIFPSLINFLWIAMESGFIFDGCAGAVGQQSKPGPEDGVTVHETGSAIDFSFLGHVEHGGSYAWRLQWSTMPTRGRNGGSSAYKESQFTGPPTRNPQHMHWYTKYSELVNLLDQLISTLPKDKRPSSVGAPFATASKLIHQDWKPNHMHIDFGSFGKKDGVLNLSGRIGKLLPQLKRYGG